MALSGSADQSACRGANCYITLTGRREIEGREREVDVRGREERGEHHLRRHIWTVCPDFWAAREVKQSGNQGYSRQIGGYAMRPIGAEILMATREGWRPLNAAEDPSESLAVSGAAARQSAERGG